MFKKHFLAFILKSNYWALHFYEFMEICVSHNSILKKIHEKQRQEIGQSGVNLKHC